MTSDGGKTPYKEPELDQYGVPLPVRRSEGSRNLLLAGRVLFAAIPLAACGALIRYRQPGTLFVTQGIPQAIAFALGFFGLLPGAAMILVASKNSARRDVAARQIPAIPLILGLVAVALLLGVSMSGHGSVCLTCGGGGGGGGG